MEIVIGPLPKRCAEAWFTRAAEVVRYTASKEGSFAFPPEASAEFFSLLRRWRDVLEDDADDFLWQGPIDPIVGELMVRYWYNIAHDLADHPSAVTPLTPDAESFTFVLLRALLDGSVSSGRLEPDVAQRMWDTWPRLGDDRHREG
jgi:hypothetical protein